MQAWEAYHDRSLNYPPDPGSSRRRCCRTPRSRLSASAARAVDKSITVGINLSLTGADAESAKRIENGAIMAFDEINAKGGVNGYKIVVTPYDDGSATAGQYDPAQAATNARKMVSNKATVAAIGPQMSGAGKGHGANPQRRQSRDHHSGLDQPRHH